MCFLAITNPCSIWYVIHLGEKAAEEIDIDLNDPDVANSAAKIQASFKGKQAIKEVVKINEGNFKKHCNDESIS